MDKMRVAIMKENAGYYASYYLSVIARGAFKALHGTAVSILIGLSVYGFASINRLEGWLAVGAFIVYCATFAAGIANIYIMGLKAERSGANHAKINRWK